jgi:hypothetical protein
MRLRAHLRVCALPVRNAHRPPRQRQQEIQVPALPACSSQLPVHRARIPTPTHRPPGRCWPETPTLRPGEASYWDHPAVPRRPEASVGSLSSHSPRPVHSAGLLCPTPGSAAPRSLLLQRRPHHDQCSVRRVRMGATAALPLCCESFSSQPTDADTVWTDGAGMRRWTPRGCRR